MSNNANSFNPFEVGRMQRLAERTTVRCECCSRFFLTSKRQAAIPGPRHCDDCVSHFPIPGEDEARELDRLRAHEPLVRDQMVRATDLLQSAYADRDQKREATRSALQSRNRWRTIAKAAENEHKATIQGKCDCGKQYPCSTKIAMDDAANDFDQAEEDYL